MLRSGNVVVAKFGPTGQMLFQLQYTKLLCAGISVAAIIDGLNGLIQARIKSFGSRSFFITKYPPGVGGFGPIPQKIRMRKYLEITDAAYLRGRSPD
jgi:hypothetical protein